MTAARLPHVVSSAPLLLSALSSFCCAGCLLPVVLPLLLASLQLLRRLQHPRCTGIVAVVVLASLPIAATVTAVVHCYCRQTQPSITNHRHHPPPPPSIDIPLSPLPCRRPLPPSNAATLPLLSNTPPPPPPPAAIAGRELAVVHCRRKRQQQHHHQCTNGSTSVKTFTSPENLD